MGVSGNVWQRSCVALHMSDELRCGSVVRLTAPRGIRANFKLSIIGAHSYVLHLENKKNTLMAFTGHCAGHPHFADNNMQLKIQNAFKKCQILDFTLIDHFITQRCQS